MQTIATSLTGPVAYAVGLIGIAIAGGTMLWGGELTEFGRRACMIGLVVSVLVFAAPMLATRLRRQAPRWCSVMATDRPREIVIHQSAQSSEPDSRRRSRTGPGDDSVPVSLAFSLATLVGFRFGRGFLGRGHRCPATDGQSRSDDAAGLHAAHTIPAVLSGEERTVLDLSSNAG